MSEIQKRDVMIYDATTGEITYRDFTDEERAEDERRAQEGEPLQ
jgi:hypothetical protein